jgi:hypothetical protein
MNFLAMQELPPALPIRTLHQHIQSVGATGGVYKGQGRNQHAFVPVDRQLSPLAI